MFKMNNNQINDAIRVLIFAIYGLTLNILESNDNSTWTSLYSEANTAGQLLDSGWINPTMRYFQVQIVNGATQQGGNIYANGQQANPAPIDARLALYMQEPEMLSGITDVALSAGTNYIGFMGNTPDNIHLLVDTVNSLGALLGANASYTSPTIDRLRSNPTPYYFRASAHADQAGTFYMDESDDNVAWSHVQTINVSAGVTAIIPNTSTSGKQYTRFVFTNGAIAQASYFLLAYAMSSRGTQDVQVVNVPNVVSQVSGKSSATQTFLNAQTATGFGPEVAMGNYDQVDFDISGVGLTGLTMNFFEVDPVSNAACPLQCSSVSGGALALANSTSAVPTAATDVGASSPSTDIHALAAPVSFQIAAYGDVLTGTYHSISLASVSGLTSGALIAAAVQAAIRTVYSDLSFAYTTVYTTTTGQQGLLARLSIKAAASGTDLAAPLKIGTVNGAVDTIGTGQKWQGNPRPGWSFVQQVAAITGTSVSSTGTLGVS
jgi:hypothetical protein